MIHKLRGYLFVGGVFLMIAAPIAQLQTGTLHATPITPLLFLLGLACACADFIRFIRRH